MSDISIMLLFICFMLVVIFMYLRWIYLKIEYGREFDLKAPVNCYGESFTDAIQNGIVRGQRGVTTYD